MATGITLKSPKNQPKREIFHDVCVAKIPTKIVPKKCNIVSAEREREITRNDSDDDVWIGQVC